MSGSRSGNVRLFAALINSLRGIRDCWFNEPAFRLDIVVVVVLGSASFFVARSTEQMLLLNAPLLLLLIVEILNSAIENTVDRIGPETHQLSGRAKDQASAAVLFCLVLIGLSWGLILWQNFVTEADPQIRMEAQPEPGESMSVPDTTQQHQGGDTHCVVVPPKNPVMCTMQYDPVCGCDGTTYPNACAARAAGVPSSSPGSCDGADLK